MRLAVTAQISLSHKSLQELAIDPIVPQILTVSTAKLGNQLLSLHILILRSHVGNMGGDVQFVETIEPLPKIFEVAIF